jgi:glycine cleavage system H protein
LRFGFSAYAVRLLQDVYFLDWSIEAPSTLTAGQEMGSIESKKAESSLFSPLQANLLRFNDELMEDPGAINTDKHDGGWLFETDNQVQEEAQQLLSAEAYLELLVTVWEKTQRTIKGQLNE